MNAHRVISVLAAVAVPAAGFVGLHSAGVDLLATVRPATAAADPSPTTSTTAIPTTTTASAAEGPTRARQQRLHDLGYDTGLVDGRTGPRLTAAVIAFQKVEGLARTGQFGPDVDAALRISHSPSSVVPDGETTRVEVDVDRQVLLFWSDGRLARVLPVSTGSGRRYCVTGGCEYAVTPTGRFTITRKVNGYDPGPLGSLSYPMYFHQGVAVHGYPSVPTTPASHGCVRVPLWSARGLFAQVPLGTPVYVVAK